GIALARPVLDLKLEAADRAQPLHGRSWKDGDERILYGGELLIELHGYRATREGWVAALLEGLQRHEHNAGIGAVGEAVDRQARESDGVLDARLLERDLAHAPDHVFRSIEGRGIRQLGEADKILLVLCRHKAAGYGLEEPKRQPHESKIDAQHHRLARD